MTKRMLGDGNGERGYAFQKGSPDARIQMLEHCDRLNSLGESRHWFIGQDGLLAVRSKFEQEQEMWRNDRIMPDDVTSVNFGLKMLGKPYRFTQDGYAYNLEYDDVDPAPDSFPMRERLAVIERREEQERRAQIANRIG